MGVGPRVGHSNPTNPKFLAKKGIKNIVMGFNIFLVKIEPWRFKLSSYVKKKSHPL